MRANWAPNLEQEIVSLARSDRLRNRVKHLELIAGVDPATGRVIRAVDDARIEGPLALVVRRTYASGWAHRSSITGVGWSLSLDQAVWLEPGKIVWRDGDGREVELDAFGLPGRAPRIGSIVVSDGVEIRAVENGYRVESDAGAAWFATMGEEAKLVSLSKDGHLIQLVHDDAGRPIAASIGTGRVELRYKHGKLSGIDVVDPLGGRAKAARYAYDEEGDLVSAWDGTDGATRYEYVGHVLVAEHVGDATTYWGYDGTGPTARCIRTWTNGPYDDWSFRYRRRACTATDGAGGLHRFAFDVIHRPTKTASGSYAWDGEGRLIAFEDRDGHSTHYTYDGPLLACTSLPDGSLEHYEHDSGGRVIARIDPTGAEHRARYDGYGVLVETIDAAGRRCAVEVEQGRPSVIWKGERAIELASDAAGRLLRAGRATIDRDARGNVVRVEDESGVRTIERDGQGRIAGVRRDGQESRFGWDQSGRLIRARCPEGDFTIERDAGGLPRVIESPMLAAELLFDPCRRLIEVRDRRGRTWRFVRDKLGRVVEETDFDGRGYAIRYDGISSRVEALALPDGSRIRYRYDACGRAISVRASDGIEQRFVRDGVGRLIFAARGEVAYEIARDGAGLVIGERCGDHHVLSSYDGSGARRAITSSLGVRVSAIPHDAGIALRIAAPGLGDREHALDALPKAADADWPVSASGEIKLDRAGRVREWNDGRSIAFYRYSVDGLLTEIERDGVRTAFSYDAFGRLVASRGRTDRQWVWDRDRPLHRLASDARPLTIVCDPDSGAPLATLEGELSWTSALKGGLAQAHDEHWFGPGRVFSCLAAQDLTPSPLDARPPPFAHRPYALVLAERASDGAIAGWIEALTTPSCLANADRIDAPFPTPIYDSSAGTGSQRSSIVPSPS